MNVQELIDQLQKVEDKNLQVMVSKTRYGDYLLDPFPHVEFVSKDQPITVLDCADLEEIQVDNPDYEYDQALIIWAEE